MDFVSIVIIGIGLAMDCFAVSISKGMQAKKFHVLLTLRMAIMFGLFQALMPLIGYAAGGKLISYMKAANHWIAFVLLLLIGLKMIYEELKPKYVKEINTSEILKLSSVFSLALATSIDALATGIVFVSFPGSIYKAITIIGSISFIFSLAGMYIGVHFGKKFNVKVEIIGGLILIGIGIKILIEHYLN